eukprot:scaffold78099_cov16-Tisochrysis_lutea.AAC.4
MPSWSRNGHNGAQACMIPANERQGSHPPGGPRSVSAQRQPGPRGACGRKHVRVCLCVGVWVVSRHANKT